ncbi:acyltransferase family protein [Paraburkholderia sp. CNPSo 3157]|uniref:Acyltransferase family protein n=1 Tax=Paraburkholderia franconis TaxID=2654983 RepID=A0A7X1N8V3_9BURK|nr:acyltransferase [Paraburkholderia franconis]MPW17389.1 acyltransferase family protein [Paraburkholderia franconis]
MTPHSSTLSRALARDANNFDLVRLVAACAVVYCHAYVIQRTDATDGVASALGFDGAGSLGVYAFFLLSGLLVSASFDRQRSVPRFIVLRLARLLPALVGASLAAIFVVGPIFTTLTLHDYFASGITWRNLDYFSTLVMKRGWTLPGVFEHNRFAHDVCAPLWTLPLEVRCYLLVLVTGVFGLLSTRKGSLIAVLLAAAAFSLRVNVAELHVGWRDFAEKAGGYSFFPEPFFFLGMLLYGWREHVNINGLAALGLMLVFLVFRDTAGAQALFYLAFVYGLLWVSATPSLRRWVPRHDYSYAIYLYGFMVQQCVAALAPRMPPMLSILVSAPFILACAALSSRWIERPAMNWCRARLARSAARKLERDATAESAPTSAADLTVRWPPF